MIVLKLLAKLLLVPVVICLTVIKWAGVFLNSISGAILGILSFFFVLAGIAGLVLGMASGSNALKIIIIGFVFFIIPSIGDWIITMIDTVNTNICTYIWN